MGEAYYPVCLDLRGRSCVVVGGGEVAERKARRLMECGAAVTVVAPQVTPALAGWSSAGAVSHIAQAYRESHLAGAFLVIGATNDGATNAAVSRDGRRRGVLVNIADDPARCDFILPSVLQRGDLLISVSTGGASPALAKQVRESLESFFGAEYGILVKILSELRRRILARSGPSDKNRELFDALVSSGLRETLRRGDWTAARRIVRDITGEEMEIDPTWMDTSSGRP